MVGEDDLYDEEILRDITPNVMACLINAKFFARLEGIVFPDSPEPNNLCNHSFAFSAFLLAEDGHDVAAQEDIFAVMRSQGGFCDCEIIWNVAEDSPAREAYWKTRSAQKEIETEENQDSSKVVT